MILEQKLKKSKSDFINEAKSIEIINIDKYNVKLILRGETIKGKDNFILSDLDKKEVQIVIDMLKQSKKIMK